MTDWIPGTEREAALAAAVEAHDVAGYLRVLADGELLLPIDADAAVRGDALRWATFPSGDTRVLAAYTSGTAMLAATDGAFTTFRKVTLATLLDQWPDASWQLGVDVNLPVGAIFPVDQVRAALGPAPAGDERPSRPVESPAERPTKPTMRTEVAPDTATGPDAGNGTPSVMQKVLPPDQVRRYLDDGYDLVAGYVYKAADAAPLATVRDIVTGLGLTYEGSPFDPDDEYVWVIRWRSVVASVFRVPFGGTDASHLPVWGDKGWVVEHAPFAGNGFAPHPSIPIPEWKVDSTRLTSGAEMYRIDRHGRQDLVAVYSSSAARWQRPAGGTA
ncbi:SseB family protein [Actinocatenispora rupis]|uniref:SseB protein N-terminal domain-containing protein n=1 Tax=Actinocatenispora rupis TaxID=519421 RepID=A0A8J3IZT1_9ACTN|nr:SseB family protein [Actinocatenispora rupis]GID09347.1 hypothetical protein Aru02nite_02360 [Actinocatenispora rupis]